MWGGGDIFLCRLGFSTSEFASLDKRSLGPRFHELSMDMLVAVLL